MRLSWLILSCVLLATASLCATADETKAPAKAARPKTTDSLDDQLLKDLDNEFLEGVGGLKPSQPKPSAEKPAKPGEGKLELPPGEDIGQHGEEDPLIRIGRNMRAAGGLIEEKQSSEKAIGLQRQIVADLAKLIEELEKQQQQKQSSSSQSNPQQTAQREQVQQPKSSSGNPAQSPSNKPAQDSSNQLRKNELQKTDMAQMKGLMKDLWGQLPAKAREQMMQSSPEQFLPKYELLIEKYYKRLAEEQKKE